MTVQTVKAPGRMPHARMQWIFMLAMTLALSSPILIAFALRFLHR